MESPYAAKSEKSFFRRVVFNKQAPDVEIVPERLLNDQHAEIVELRNTVKLMEKDAAIGRALGTIIGDGYFSLEFDSTERSTATLDIGLDTVFEASTDNPKTNSLLALLEQAVSALNDSQERAKEVKTITEN